MKNFQEIDKKEYKDLLSKVSFSTFFHGIEWHDFLEKEFKWLKFEYYLYKDEAYNSETLLPLARFKVFGKEKLISLPFCEYGGPLRLGEFNIDEFNKDVLAEFGDSIKIKIWPQVSEPFGKASNITSIASSHWLRDLKFKNEVWDSFRKTLRHEIEHAQKHNLEIRKSSNEQELKRFYDLYAANLKRKKTVPYPWPLIQFLCKNASSELLLAVYKGKVIAGCLFLNYSDNGFVHYFLSASDYRHRNLGANYLIIWEKIKGLIGQNKTLDLGASPRGSNLEIFKRGWGGEELPIYQIGAKKSEEHLRSSKLRNIWGLMPNFIVKKLSPYLIKYRL